MNERRMNERMEAYLRGELALDEAQAFEAEVARANATPEGGVVSEAEAGHEVRDAWRALDSIEGKVGLRRRWERRWVVPAMVLAAAAVALLVAWLAWPQAAPERVAPAPVRVPKVASFDAKDEPDVTPEVSQLAVAEVTAPGPEEIVAGVAESKDLVIDLATSPLGRGAEWRRQRVPSRGVPALATMTVLAHPRIAVLAASDLLDAVVRCVDDHGPKAGRYEVELSTAKDERRVIVPRDAMLERCLDAYDLDSAEGGRLWQQMGAPGATFVVVLTEAHATPAPKKTPVPKKVPGPQRDKSPGGKSPERLKDNPW